MMIDSTSATGGVNTNTSEKGAQNACRIAYSRRRLLNYSGRALRFSAMRKRKQGEPVKTPPLLQANSKALCTHLGRADLGCA